MLRPSLGVSHTMLGFSLLLGALFVLTLSGLTPHVWGHLTPDDPFTPGPYSVSSYKVDPRTDKSPLQTTVYTPVAKGTYNPIVFVGGMYGYVGSSFYSDLLTEIATHGQIVYGMDALPLDPKGQLASGNGPWKDGVQGRRTSLSAKYEEYMQQLLWLQQHASNRTSAVPDWSQMSLMCHSAGCDDTLLMINASRSLFKASVYLDPVSPHALLMQPFPSKVATLTYMAQLSEEKPDCCIPGMGWKKIYDLMTCVKVRMEVKDFGHCDVLDHLPWEGCHLSKICKTTNDTRLADYRHQTSGVVTSFIQWTVLGNKDMARYVTNPSAMPLPLVDLAFNTTCVF
ncbi:uncharacterized protein LOC131953150 [Physella acuta]|uniref:uncharacterized protein LOC131953150 n=1 Tax=Physella acuta TaxID=109671 RepID=UPI0027DAC42C|nr:uncharacterized protein LOC131953150 [Physella acuta]